VVAVDHPAYNHNGMRGIRALKAALGSAVEIHELDADRPFTLPHDTYDLVFFLGILYHLRNPFYVLEELARRTTHCFLNTRVARRFPDGSAMPANVALAYLLAEEELNQDNSNYFIFSEPGLRVMLDRAHWRIRDYVSLGDTSLSDPVRLELTAGEGDTPAVHVGQTLRFEVKSAVGQTFMATVRYVAPALRAATRDLVFEAVAPNPDGILKPGSFATAWLETGTEQSVVVPSSALRKDGDSVHAFVIKDKHIEERIVHVEREIGDRTAIRTGIADGERLVQNATDTLKDGLEVVE